jgi:CheY-like chemotaxis protein
VRVLLVEDNPVNQEVAVGLLEALDCAVTVGENGKEALAAALNGRFDIVLMDCQMPVMDGLEATRAIREALKDRSDHLPIIALTADILPEAKAACFEAGMDDVLNKPFRLEELDALLDRWCSARAAVATGTSSEPLTSDETVLNLVPIESLRSLDPTGEKDIVRRAIQKFADYGDGLIEQVISHAREHNAAEVSRLAHSLKSSSANLGAEALSRLSSALEEATKSGELPNDIDRHVAGLAAAYQTAKRELMALSKA